MPTPRPVALIVLDGWGLSPEREANAVALAHTPTFDGIVAHEPHATLRTSGADVGLPAGQMGNSEVGHLNLGAGFVVDQDLTRIATAIDDGTIFDNAVLVDVATRVRDRSATLHVLGLIGDGGVHAHTDHILAVVELARRCGAPRVLVHAFTDGRDTPPDSGLGFMVELNEGLTRIGLGRVATVCGRYWAMDRDRRWPRTERAWKAIAEGVGETAPTAAAAIERSYAGGVTDEFIEPTVIVDDDGVPIGCLADGDGVVMANFRADRMRQMLAALTDPGFSEFERHVPDDLAIATMTEYTRDQAPPAAFPPLDVSDPIAGVIAGRGLRQFHAAETEKYAHVTYFFNGGREQPFDGEERCLVPSPQVATYDLQPEMSAVELTDCVVERIEQGTDDFIIVNYANPDMVGHTGDLDAATKAVATVDACLGRVLDALRLVGGVAVVTADHGNAETMVDPETGGPHTAHTLNPVPIVLVGYRPAEPGALVRMADGRLADVAPTLLDLMGIPRPDAMTGRSLVEVVGPTDARESTQIEP